MRKSILEAAVRVFMRYGVGRTRMSDIAAEAGIVRQTIYSFFKNKDQILCASIRHYSEKSLAEIEQQWSSHDDLAEILDIYFERSIISSFAIVTASPDARDMIGGYNAAGKEETERAQANKIAAWARKLADNPVLTIGTIPPAQLAEYIVTSSLGIRDLAKSEKQLRALLEIHKRGILSIAQL